MEVEVEVHGVRGRGGVDGITTRGRMADGRTMLGKVSRGAIRPPEVKVEVEVTVSDLITRCTAVWCDFEVQVAVAVSAAAHVQAMRVGETLLWGRCR